MLSALRTDLLELAKAALEYVPDKPLRKKPVVGLFFDEPSTRTRISSQAALARLGATAVVMDNLRELSIAKGEAMSDTAAVIGQYFDILAVRSRYAGLPLLLAQHSEIPVLNLGDGANEHPSQALATLATCKLRFGALEGLRLVIWGDLEHGRVAHSVFLAAAQAKMHITLVPASGYSMPSPYLRLAAGAAYDLAHSLQDVGEFDVLYVTREQRERRTTESSRKPYPAVRTENIRRAKLILHPLPRGPEIPEAVWQECKKDILAHARVTYRIRQWLYYGLYIGSVSDGLDALIRHKTPMTCINPLCAKVTFEPHAQQYKIFGEQNMICAWCRHTLGEHNFRSA